MALKFIALPAPLNPDQPGSFVRTDASEKPCRRCLQDSQPDEPMVLVAYDPFTADGPASPYTGTGPVFVHQAPCTPYVGRPGEVPAQQRSRLLSLRGYDEKHHLKGFEVVEGEHLEKAAERVFSEEGVRFVNVHYAGPGCFAVRMEMEGKKEE